MRRDVPQNQLFKARFVDRYFAIPEGFDLSFVVINADHFVAHLSEASSGDQPNVTGPNNCDFHKSDIKAINDDCPSVQRKLR